MTLEKPQNGNLSDEDTNHLLNLLEELFNKSSGSAPLPEEWVPVEDADFDDVFEERIDEFLEVEEAAKQKEEQLRDNEESQAQRQVEAWNKLQEIQRQAEEQGLTIRINAE
jgi:hypothetical protein